jgi:pyruvate formate-lyase/glycerol dehydratase family glycyl radical enzyme
MQGTQMNVIHKNLKPELETTSWRPSATVMKLRAEHDASVPALGAERAIHYTKFYKTTKEPSAALRKAKALADHLARRSIRIYDGEVIVGTHTEHRIGAICYAELAGVVMLEDIFRFESRQINPLHVNPSAKRELLLSVIPYWLTRNLAARAFPFAKRMQYFRDQLDGTRFIITEAGGVAHFVPNFEDIIAQGTNGLRARINKGLKKPGLTPEKQNQLEAGLITLDALEAFSDRYKSLAVKQGRQDIADVLAQVPRKPASNLREALQMVWLFQMVIQIESLDQGISLGRLDQYLYPLYLKEISRGSFDADIFRDDFCAFCLKLSEVIPLFSNRITESFAGLPIGQAVTLGGINENGGDASNALTFLLLDVIDHFKTRQPNWHARLNSKSKNAYVARVFEVIARGGGSPSVYNDDVIMPSLGKRFDAKTLLWNYVTAGCVELTIPNISFTSTDAALFNYPRILENVLAHVSGKTKGRGGKPLIINSMAELIDALEDELRVEVASLKEGLDAIERSNRIHHPVPFSSLTVEGCIENATDLTAGGALINGSGIQAIGLADLANSLAAIETLVFERSEMTLLQLARACQENFANDPSLKARLAGFSKFGNDETQVDGFAQEMMGLFDRVISENKNTRGGRWMPGVFSMTCHRSMGRKSGALPSGRSAGEPFADGLAPTDGSDCLGPTASLNSVAGIDPAHMPNGINLNLKFDANTLKGRGGAKLLEGLVRGYFHQGGMQVQINVLDPEVLLEAQRMPEKHKNLLVRISGYSAYFVDLSPELQDEIIARTLQGGMIS